jgi:predicted metalloprotease
MRWTSSGRSRNLEDRRGERVGGGMVRRGLPMGLGGLLLLFLLSLLTGQDLMSLFGGIGGGGPVVVQQPGFQQQAPANVPAQSSPQEEKLVDFVSWVLDDAQATWQRLLPGQYRETKLALFRELVRSGCGMAQAGTGPFYCPADEKVYIDLGFYEELARRFGAPGDFAQAYVLAHEIGHHVQKVIGVEQQVRQMQQARPNLANRLSVAMELQADCFAGIWGHSTARRDILEEGDIEEGLRAAGSIGDDRIQKMTQGYVQPESFTHGTSQQRMEWFMRGLRSGDPKQCDAFNSGT